MYIHRCVREYILYIYSVCATIDQKRYNFSTHASLWASNVGKCSC